MNCPSRVDPDALDNGYNQNPDALNADATTRADQGHVANARLRRSHRLDQADGAQEVGEIERDGHVDGERRAEEEKGKGVEMKALDSQGRITVTTRNGGSDATGGGGGGGGSGRGVWGWGLHTSRKGLAALRNYAKFVGPGFMVAVAYIDPGNYATDVAAGASYRFSLLFIVLMSNIFAIVLQSLCIKLGSVTGLNLAENCRAHLPRWMNYSLYVLAEAAIIATDMAEVIGTAIALNILSNNKIPLVAGCAISIVDVIIILIFYRPQGTMKSLRFFEAFVVLLVLGVVVCFCYELSTIKAPVGDVFKGYLPSSALVEAKALYQACGILGATVMPHSLYLGSGIVQPRLQDFDDKHPSSYSNNTIPPSSDSLAMPPSRSSSTSSAETLKYKPSLAAIQACMSYSIAEVAFSLFTFALFVNSAILIVAGASLYGHPEADSADLFSIHDLLSTTIAPAAGTMFALALLLSGTSAGIVCTISGQMVSEGQLNWTLKPWLRRLITRSISITPSIIIAAAVGKKGLGAALEASQVVLSVILPFVSAPLIWWTCRAKYMKVAVRREEGNARVVGAGAGAGAGDDAVRVEAEAGADAVEGAAEREFVQMRNHWVTSSFAVLIWGVIVVMNVALLVLVGLGVA